MIIISETQCHTIGLNQKTFSHSSGNLSFTSIHPLTQLILSSSERSSSYTDIKCTFILAWYLFSFSIFFSIIFLTSLRYMRSCRFGCIGLLSYRIIDSVFQLILSIVSYFHISESILPVSIHSIHLYESVDSITVHSLISGFEFVEFHITFVLSHLKFLSHYIHT